MNKIGKKTKATYHSGRTTKAGKVFNANHNTNKKTRDGQNHIRHDRTEQNILYRIENNKLKPCKSYDCIEFEKRRYKELFSESLEAKNQRYIKQRHKERCRDIEDLYRDPKKCPFELVLQIGKANDEMTFEEKADLSKRVNIDFVREMHKRFGANFVPLDLSGHYDETTPHWHYRAVFVYQSRDGLEPNQSKALESLGIERPDKTKPIGKHNNPLMTFTAKARERMGKSMKCSVIRDLIPNYIDGLNSVDSNKLIEEHLCTCEECKAYYRQMKKGIKTDMCEENGELNPFVKIKRNTLRKVFLAVFVTVCVMSIMWEKYITYYTNGVSMYAEEVEVLVEERNGIATLRFEPKKEDVVIDIGFLQDVQISLNGKAPLSVLCLTKSNYHEKYSRGKGNNKYQWYFIDDDTALDLFSDVNEFQYEDDDYFVVLYNS